MLLVDAGIGTHNVHSLSPAREASELRNPEEHDFKLSQARAKLMDGMAKSRAVAGEQTDQNVNAVRFSNPDTLSSYLEGRGPHETAVTQEHSLQETCFLGLRLTQGLNLNDISVQFGNDVLAVLSPTIAECVDYGLLERKGDYARLTAKGRLLSNEVFGKFITEPVPLSS